MFTALFTATFKSPRSLPVGSLALLALMLTVTACSTPRPGVSNQMGTIKTELNASPPRVIQAAEAALRDMDLTITSSWATAVDGHIEATTPENTITVSAEHQTEDTSRVAIHVGLLGDESISLAVLNRIKRRLDADQASGRAQEEQVNQDGAVGAAATQPME